MNGLQSWSLDEIGAAANDHNHDDRYLRWDGKGSFIISTTAPGNTNGMTDSGGGFMFEGNPGTPFKLWNQDTSYYLWKSVNGGTWTKMKAGYADSAGDADTVDGLHVHAGRNNEANKVVRTDASGYIQSGWINTTSGNMGTTTINKVYVSNDDYIRYKTPANFFSELSNSGNDISITVADLNRKLTVGYANHTNYIGVPRNDTSSGHLNNNANNFAGQTNKFWVDEMSSSNTNGATNNWHYIMSMNGSDSDYAGQLALGMTVDGLWYRAKHASWSGWSKVATEDWVSRQGYLTSYRDTVGQIYANGTANANGNSSATNPYVNIYHNYGADSHIRLIGSDGISIKSDGSGNITIDGTDLFGYFAEHKSVDFNFVDNDFRNSGVYYVNKDGSIVGSNVPGDYGLLVDLEFSAGHLQLWGGANKNDIKMRSYWWTQNSGFGNYPDWVTVVHSGNIDDFLKNHNATHVRYDDGGAWIEARSHALVSQTTYHGNSWRPIGGIKTMNGYWSFGSVQNDEFTFSWDSDSDYNANNNVSKNILCLYTDNVLSKVDLNALGAIRAEYINYQYKFYTDSNGAYWTSDIRSKHDFSTITKEDVDKFFSNTYFKHFKWNDTNHDSWGVVAQEFEEWAPEAINTNEEGYKAANYDVAEAKAIAAMIYKIKEQQTTINNLTEKIEKLEKMIEKLL